MIKVYLSVAVIGMGLTMTNPVKADFLPPPPPPAADDTLIAIAEWLPTCDSAEKTAAANAGAEAVARGLPVAEAIGMASVADTCQSAKNDFDQFNGRGGGGGRR